MRRYKTYLERLERAARRKAKMYHATRVVLDVQPGRDPAGGSGVDPSTGWSEFLGPDVVVFGAREYERNGRWQQSCYYGENRLDEYRPLAREGWQALPSRLAIPLDLSEDPVVERDVWTLAMYRLALDDRTAFGLDLRGALPYADHLTPGLEKVVAADRRGEFVLTDHFQSWCQVVTRHRPVFVYATLKRDVFSASRHAVEVLCRRSAEFCRFPLDICAVAVWEEIARRMNGRGPVRRREGERVAPRNDDRNRHLYERRQAGATYQELIRDVDARPEWSSLSRPSSIQAAINSFADFHDLPRPSPGQAGDGFAK